MGLVRIGKKVIALYEFSYLPNVKEAYSNFWKQEFPDGGYESCWAGDFYKPNGLFGKGIEFEVKCTFHNQTNLFQCALLKDETVCVTHVGPFPGATDDGLIPVDSPYSKIYIPDEILGRKVTQIGRGGRKHLTFSASIAPVTEGLKGLKELVLPETITQINNQAFGGDVFSSFAEPPLTVNIPNSVNRIGYWMFVRETGSGYSQINIDIAPEQEFFAVIDDAIYDKANRRLISYIGNSSKERAFEVPQGIRYIGAYSFDTAGFFSTIHIPSSVLVVCEKAFNFCSIDELIIDKGVKTIQASAFDMSVITKKVILPESVIEIGDNAFGYSKSTTFVVTRESYAAKWAIDNNYKREYSDALDWLK